MSRSDLFSRHAAFFVEPAFGISATFNFRSAVGQLFGGSVFHVSDVGGIGWAASYRDLRMSRGLMTIRSGDHSKPLLRLAALLTVLTSVLFGVGQTEVIGVISSVKMSRHWTADVIAAHAPGNKNLALPNRVVIAIGK